MLHEQTSERTVRRPRALRPRRMRQCAVLIDFEAVYSNLAEESPPQPSDDHLADLQILDDAVGMLSELRTRLRDRHHGVVTIGRSYADFDRMEGDAQSQLQLLAFEPRFMLGDQRKSSADTLLSMDAVELLYTRPELDMFVIVGGGRSYLPVVRRIREHMKHVVFVACEKSAMEDMVQLLGDEDLVTAEALLSDAPAAAGGGNGYAASHSPTNGEDSGDGDAAFVSQESSDDPSDDETLEHCMAELLAAYYQYGGRTVWLTPFLRILNDKFPYLDNRGRKRMVEDLQARNAIRIDKVEGDPYPYSVVEINWENSWVKGLDEARGNS